MDWQGRRRKWSVKNIPCCSRISTPFGAFWKRLMLIILCILLRVSLLPFCSWQSSWSGKYTVYLFWNNMKSSVLMFYFFPAPAPLPIPAGQNSGWLWHQLFSLFSSNRKFFLKCRGWVHTCCFRVRQQSNTETKENIWCVSRAGVKLVQCRRQV